MEVKISQTPDSIEVAIIGRLDTLTSPELDQALKPIIATSDMLIFECTDLEYVSSSGLRVILFTQKMQSAAGKKFVIRNLNKEVRSVFDLTGFSKIITIEDGVLRGGVGEAITSFLNDNGYNTKVARLGIEDKFIEHGTLEQLHAICGFDKEGIVAKIKELL